MFVFSTQKINLWSMLSLKADLRLTLGDAGYVVFGVVLFVWELLPTSLVVFFFRVRRPAQDRVWDTLHASVFKSWTWTCIMYHLWCYTVKVETTRCQFVVSQLHRSTSTEETTTHFTFSFSDSHTVTWGREKWKDMNANQTHLVLLLSHWPVESIRNPWTHVLIQSVFLWQPAALRQWWWSGVEYNTTEHSKQVWQSH